MTRILFMDEIPTVKEKMKSLSPKAAKELKALVEHQQKMLKKHERLHKLFAHRIAK